MKYELPELLQQRPSPFYGLSWPLIVGVVVCLGLLTLTTWHTSVDPDTYMHLTIGRWILDHGAIPRTDMYSHSLHGHPWVAHEWLSEYILAVLYALGGWTALVLVTALSLALTLAFLVRFLLHRVPAIYAILFTALAYSALVSHLLIRPHIFSWPILVMWVGVLINASERQIKPPMYLLALMVLWANLHGSFILGLAIAIPLGVQAVWIAPSSLRGALARSWILFWVLSVISCVATPLGWQGLLFPLSLLKLTHLTAINEWMPYHFSGLSGLEIVILSYLFLALIGYIDIGIINALIIVGLLHQALTHNRYASIFGLITPMIIASSFGARYKLVHASDESQHPSRVDEIFNRLSVPATKKATLLFGAIILASAFFLSRGHHHEPSKEAYPVAAVDFAINHQITGPVFNAYEFGGYLISRGIPVFIDGRADLYDEAILGPYLEAIRDGSASVLDSLMRDYKITWVLIPPDSSARTYFDSREQWKNIYEDKLATIFVLRAAPLDGQKLIDSMRK
ncbi:hypothetical protein [Polynucleobacter sp. AP-Nino-20-G2]|uniref:hypothetical protein n=1 Tax=Polynucleobacter sp. AP-Nino-20-G2 TaxID=2576917 RepID=UPI001BFD8147|nr:hypothetical protein [Polynucleobacter sp. AP-Nino-20-G2]QWE17247.1 hypothetical protein FD960_03255 [Polynucleobacter sp. AP-Nino-20-G2]